MVVSDPLNKAIAQNNTNNNITHVRLLSGNLTQLIENTKNKFDEKPIEEPHIINNQSITNYKYI
jgi:hypothetical protein